MRDEHLETLSAFIDGEAGNTEALIEALRQAKAAEVLIDFLTLRAELELDSEQPRDSFRTAMLSRIGQRSSPLRSRRFRALAAGLGWLAAGWLLFARMMGPEVSESARTPDTQVLLRAPEPQQVIRFQPGVDWWPAHGGSQNPSSKDRPRPDNSDPDNSDPR